jgi:hypothetical protein
MIVDQALSALKSEISGSLWLPADVEYQKGRLPWNLSVDQRPSAVVEPAGRADVQRVVRRAAEAGLRVTAQAHGHGADGSLEGCVLIRTAALAGVAIDPAGATARVGAGVDWTAVLARLEGTGLVALAGSNPAISVVGYSLGGGHSFFSRAFGLASESMTAVELVNAMGEVHRITDDSDPDLMWALRGGGGLLGIVTSMEFRLHPARALYGGTVMFPAEATQAVCDAAIELAAEHPRLGLDPSVSRFPDSGAVPPPLRGKTVAGIAIVHLGDAESAKPIINRIHAIGKPIVDAMTTFTIGQLGTVANEPTVPTPVRDWATTINRFDRNAADAFATALHTALDRGVVHADTRVLGGSISAPSDALLGGLSAEALAHASVILADPSTNADAALEPLDEFSTRHPGAGMVPSFLGAGGRLSDCFDEQRLSRLASIKQRMDPAGLIHSNRR